MPNDCTAQGESMGKDVIVALDFPGRKEVFSFLELFAKEERKPFVKIGMELFYAEGPEIVREIKTRGHKIFLDLKLHDIPNTVKGGMHSLRDLDVDMTNVHAGGGIEMMKAGLEGLQKEDGSTALLLAVTILTSTSQEALRSEMWIEHGLPETVRHYAENAKAAGLPGVVCSPLESAMIHEKIGGDFLTVTPGIRFAGSGVQDQKRVLSPGDAKKMGSDYIVMGRPITKAENPVSAYRRACEEFLG